VTSAEEIKGMLAKARCYLPWKASIIFNRKPKTEN
jgi:hypothetical protein